MHLIYRNLPTGIQNAVSAPATVTFKDLIEKLVSGHSHVQHIAIPLQKLQAGIPLKYCSDDPLLIWLHETELCMRIVMYIGYHIGPQAIFRGN